MTGGVEISFCDHSTIAFATIVVTKEVLLVLLCDGHRRRSACGNNVNLNISTKSLDLLVKRGALGTGAFDGHRGRTACGDNVNFD
jgi:hypothetical protein